MTDSVLPTSTSASAASRDGRRDPATASVPWRALALFVLLAYGLAWLVTVPLWREGGLGNPLLAPLGFAMMATPAVAVMTVTLLVLRPAHPVRFLGLLPVRPTRRLLGFVALGFVGVQLLALLAVLLAAALGVVTLTVSGGSLRSLALAPVFSLFSPSRRWARSSAGAGSCCRFSGLWAPGPRC